MGLAINSNQVIKNESKPVHELAVEKNLSTYSQSIWNENGEFMTLFSKIVAERTKPLQRQDVIEQGYVFHVYGRPEGIAGVIISDHDYPAYVVQQLLSRVMVEFLAKYPREMFATSNPTLAFPELKDILTDYQDVTIADNIMEIQRQMDERNMFSYTLAAPTEDI